MELRVFSVSTLTMASTFLAGVVVANAASPHEACQAGRHKAAAQYAACHQKYLASFFGGAFDTGFLDDPDGNQTRLSKCRDKYRATWAKLQAKASGTGVTCDAARLLDNGDGTVTDNLTGLQWEKKTDDASVHDKDDTYKWTTVFGGTEANGTIFTSFLATLNGGGCFAGQCDWRLPTVAELQTILLEPFPCAASPCIDPIFGPMAADAPLYWSSTTNAESPDHAWYVIFLDGFLGDAGSVGYAGATKPALAYVRAVRGGLCCRHSRIAAT
jgi:hypothetical protein